MQVVASLKTLFQYAKELGQAEQSGDRERIRNAKKRHDNYFAFFLSADRVIHAPSVATQEANS